MIQIVLIAIVCFTASIQANELQSTVDKILSGASSTCKNKIVTGPYPEGVLCGGLIPTSILDKVEEFLGISLTFSYDSATCSALACMYRLMGCAEPTYRVEAAITKAGFTHKECLASLADTLNFLPNNTCTQLAKFVGTPPVVEQDSGKKREVAEVQSEEEFNADAKAVARSVIRAWDEEVYNQMDFSHDESEEAVRARAERKRGTFDGILDQVQLCSPIISLGIQLIEEAGVTVPFNLSSKLGPCGSICEAAVCTLNILCHTTAEPILLKLKGERAAGVGNGGRMCPPLVCSQFHKAPEDKCKDITCPGTDEGGYEPGTFDITSTCIPPKVIKSPSRTSSDDCCEFCEDKCATTNCPQSDVADCGEPEWPICFEPQLDKPDLYACCPICLDGCFLFRQENEARKANGEADLCGQAPPPSCPDGQVVGPSAPGDCCFKCAAPCSGTTCPNQPNSQEDCPECTQFVPFSKTPTKCSHCCNSCVQLSKCPTPQVQPFETTGAASSLALSSVFMALLAVVALF